MTDPARFRPVMRESYAQPMTTGRESSNLGDILERVLDRGVVIAGDIRVNLLDIELLTIKLRLLIASVDTARELGIDWWEHDPWLTGKNRELVDENRRLRDRLAAIEERLDEREGLPSRVPEQRPREVEGRPRAMEPREYESREVEPREAEPRGGDGRRADRREADRRGWERSGD
ncbi:gas vesicle protein [Planotetraspora kaengkrachanensis]|uniref:Gas vesicle structural protein n=1 Tax=Planotetraspora kaengkrachanensis TaxID=575193 RepID=A0A8J3VCH4_9ACTN|nr:gas vesicle protein [Planotetraspora kaengkrachanensis]GIG84793.1 hypothetical protein Pka01_79200 [Planotetraspora kaengkrachanensis]